MTRARDYLRIPLDYTRHFGGPRWSYGGDAIEGAPGITFAFRQQVGQFLEGFFSIAPPIHFAFVVHLLHLLGYGEMTRPKEAELLAQAFKSLHWPLRNAGVLCAILCDRVPRVPGSVDPSAVLALLRAGIAEWGDDPFREMAEVPPLAPADFEAVMLCELRDFGLAELYSWLRFGREPIVDAGAKVAEELLAAPPRSLAEVFGPLARRERLAGAAPFLTQMVSALSLPPRRLADRELPLGGYADIATRGLPEQILPAQFAVDELEFVRRFAENELLYFRREEPHTRLREELIVVLDQGVRTWGDVRLLLCAAVLAFAKLAERKSVSFRVAATSADGPPLDPRTADEKAVAELLEASDLSADPGQTLERVLQEEATGPRDVVLLTHPRNLAEPDLTAAARRATPETRLFALAADEHGDCALVEMKHGSPVPVTRFRVDLTPRRAASVAKPREEPRDGQAAAWRGDVEPIGFPFYFGVSRRAGKFLFDFDAGGEWILIATHNGLLSLCRTDGTRCELLPRGWIESHVLTDVEAVLGVAGGFVVAGSYAHCWLGAVHYDLATHTARAYRLGVGRSAGERQWYYFRDLHCFAVQKEDWRFAVDLGTGETAAQSQGVIPSPGRAQAACDELAGYLLPPPQLPINSAAEAEAQRKGLHLLHGPQAATLGLYGPGIQWGPFKPQANGRPLLRGVTVHQARLCGNVLGLVTSGGEQTAWPMLRLFRVLELDAVPLREFRQERTDRGFTLSPDGAKLARRLGQCRLEVSELEGGRLVLLPRHGGYHQHVDVELGDRWLALRAGDAIFLLKWANGILQVDRRLDHGTPAGRGASLVSMGSLPPGTRARPDWLPPATCYDRERFVAGIGAQLLVGVDCFGQVAVLDRSGRLLCMFFAFRERLEAWMPDGTRWPEAGRTDGPAAAAIGAALAAAQGRSAVP